MVNEHEILNLFEHHCNGIKTSGGSQYTALCPFHDDTHHSFSFNTQTTQYYCHTCDAKGNAVKFAKQFGENPKPFYSKDYKPVKNGSITVVKPQKSSETGGKSAVKLSESELRNKATGYMSNVNYGDGLGFYQLNMVGKDNSGRTTFPYFSKNGKSVIGIKHHKSKSGGQPYWEGDGKCKWYGEWNITNKTDTIYIVEGEPDANLMGQMGVDGISSSAGAKSIPKYIPECLQNTKEVIILYDNDKAGRIGADKLAEHLTKILDIPIYIGQWREGLPDKYDVSDSKLGNEFEYAINNKRIYKPKDGGNDSQKGLKPMSFDDFTKQGWQIEKPIVQYFVGENQLTIIGGCTGIGKSWFALNLALSISSGRPFMNYFKTETRKVLYAQFELTNGQLLKRLEILRDKYSNSHFSIQKNLKILPKGDSFTSQWEALEDLLEKSDYGGGVVIVDNLYTSVDADTDLSNNPDIIPVIQKIDEIMKNHKCAIVVITHHLKGKGRQEIDIDDILGGANLTRFSSNVFQMKNSELATDLRVAKITKTRDEDCQLENRPFKVRFEDGYFIKGQVINKEVVHYTEPKDRWELQFLNEMKNYGEFRNEQEWDRDYLWVFLEEKGWEKNETGRRKVSRLLDRLTDWGFVEKVGHNKYKIIIEDE